MTTPPDPSSIDWGAVSLWATGIGAGIGSMVGATWLAIRKAVKVARDNPPTTTREETKIVTTDTVAMHELAGAIEAMGLTVIEIRKLLESEIAGRKKDREERDQQEEFARIARRTAEEVQREAEEEQDARRRTPRRP